MKKIIFCLFIGTSFIFQSCINDNEDPVAVAPTDGAVVNPDMGGATEPNQVWFDLGTNSEVITQRTDWDLAFYSGNAFKVMLNSSVMMAAGKIPDAAHIDEVTEAAVATLKDQVQVANFNPANVAFIDDVKGDFPAGYTAIKEIKANDAENPVYLVNMGNEIYSGTVATGSVATGGDSRGWMKIQVIRSGNGYKIKYANLNDTTHKELIITKNPAYNFNFVSLKSNKEVSVQPEKKKWDICFTVFTNTITGAGSYIYADFVTINTMGGAGAYEIKVAAPASGVETYNHFKASDIDQSKFIYNDQRVIGANWRNPVGANGLEVYGDRFYVIKDAEGYYFKLRFTRLTNVAGERGRPQFEFKPL
ncbi:HmuY family protein [uncultured Chryseobacterium sp.]|uniref:HmuY family protein n=1 Tax=uncultured Chryseobacterium sp. TaxID=259322 RepID=UPI00260B10C5|nr:HmuY family protein [uncultured Chryseobacterium sp.]